MRRKEIINVTNSPWPHTRWKNKCVFRWALKTGSDSAVSRRLNGSSFHARGSAAAKDRSPNLLFWRGTEQRRRSADRRDLRPDSADNCKTLNMLQHLLRTVPANRLGRFCIMSSVYCLQLNITVCTFYIVNHHHHHHIRLLEVVKRNRQHTVQKINVGIYTDIHTIHAG